eukprot:6199248-Pleurochrysis_carterae.AAC.3
MTRCVTLFRASSAAAQHRTTAARFTFSNSILSHANARRSMKRMIVRMAQRHLSIHLTHPAIHLTLACTCILALFSSTVEENLKMAQTL